MKLTSVEDNLRDGFRSRGWQTRRVISIPKRAKAVSKDQAAQSEAVVLESAHLHITWSTRAFYSLFRSVT